MSDDVIEDEATEREIRRIRRARLAATDDWCDDCHGYTHMPYCPAYVEPTSNKHKGDVMERREWTMERLPVHGYRIYDEDGSVVAPDVYRQDYAEQIVNDHNQHTALVEQRDLLVRALEDIKRFVESDYGTPDAMDDEVWKLANNALATVEQGEETR